MDTTFDHLTHLFSRFGTRRSALGTLLGVAVVGTVSETDAVKGPSEGKRPRRRKKQKKQRNGHHRARAQAKKEKGNHCIAPSGVDLNELFGVSAQIVSRFCNQVGSGEQWVNSAPWFVAPTFEAVPGSFTPAGDTPLEDFFAKFTEVKYVIDPGAKHEKTVVFPNIGNLFTGAGDLFPGIPAEWSVVSPVTLGTVQPLSIGNHIVDVYWVFSAMHCDGVAANIDENCLPAGDVKYIDGLAIEVVPGHH